VIDYYIVTDIESDGPNPGLNSMRAFASVAITIPFRIEGTFEAVLHPLPDRTGDPDTLAWFATEPEAWAAANHNPRDPAEVMVDFIRWVRSFHGTRTFVSHGLAFDGGWIDDYLARFTGERLISNLRLPDPLFKSGGLCLRSFASGVLGMPFSECWAQNYPAELMGRIPHDHKAICDATGFAHLLAGLLDRQRLQSL